MKSRQLCQVHVSAAMVAALSRNPTMIDVRLRLDGCSATTVCVYMCACVCVYMCMCMPSCVCACVRVCVHVYVCGCVCACVSTCRHVYMQSIRECVRVRTHVYFFHLKYQKPLILFTE